MALVCGAVDPSSPYKKRPRLSQDATREALIEAGKRLLLDRGLDTGLGLVSLNDAIVESGVARASAYRVFTNDDIDPQVAFRTELLIRYINADPVELRSEAAEAIVTASASGFETDDPVELAHHFRDMLRLAFAGNVAGFAEDPNWRIVGPSWAATALADWAPKELIDAHRDGTIHTAHYYLPLYRQVTSACGLRLKPEFTWDEMALLTNSTSTVASFYKRYHPELHEIMRPTGLDGELVPWSHAAILMEGLVLTLLEPDPGAKVSADLSSWLPTAE